MIQRNISTFDWETAFANCSINDSILIPNETVLNIFSNFFPSKTISCNDKQPPWITDEIKKDTSCELFSPYMIESTKIRSHVLNDQLSFHALSKLYFKNHSSFSKYLLLLSGDIDINPGPTVPCCICSKSLRQKTIFCNKCQSWFHKKCVNISEAEYKILRSLPLESKNYSCHHCLNNLLF